MANKQQNWHLNQAVCQSPEHVLLTADYSSDPSPQHQKLCKLHKGKRTHLVPLVPGTQGARRLFLQQMNATVTEA